VQYNIDTTEILEKDLTKYPNLNHFFFRQLLPTARPADDPTNPDRIVSPADSRCVAFPVMDATKYWIKVHIFTSHNVLSIRARHSPPES
jgi:phosphatidylserine decarboxylase